MMVEAGANEVPEDVVLEAIDVRPRGIQRSSTRRTKLREAGRQAEAATPRRPPSTRRSRRSHQATWASASRRPSTTPTRPAARTPRASCATRSSRDFAEQGAIPRPSARCSSRIEKDDGPQQASSSEGKRPDGRGADEIRPIIGRSRRPAARARLGPLHARPDAGADVVTLGTEADEQRSTRIGLDEPKRYMHHYNFPPF